MTSPKRIHHINLLVKDLASSIDYFSRILDSQPVIDKLKGRDVLTARYELEGQFIVLVQPLSENSTVGQILKTRGEGLFLLSLEVEDLHQCLDNLAAQGIQAVHDGERSGLLNWKVHDLIAPNAFGPVLQLCEERDSKS